MPDFGYGPDPNAPERSRFRSADSRRFHTGADIDLDIQAFFDSSPLASNIHLHEVLDLWFEREVKPRLHGRAFMVRFADDALLAFEREEDARRALEVLAKRLARFGLTLHPEKARLVDLRRPPWRREPRRPQRGRSLDLLGFTHYWGRSRNGRWLNRRPYRPSLNWDAFSRLLQRYPLPPARVVHSNYVA